MNFVIFDILIFLSPVFLAIELQEPKNTNKWNAGLFHVPGSFRIGGVYYVHEYYAGDEPDITRCSNKMIPDNILETEAHMYYLQSINKTVHDETGITLGTLLADSCFSSDIAVQRTTEFLVRASKGNLCKEEHHNFEETVPIVFSGMTSDELKFVTKNFHAVCIPILATHATASDFTTKSDALFARVVPEDKYQAEVVISLLKRMQWHHIGIVFESGHYSASFKRDIDSHLTHKNCAKRLQNTREALLVNGSYNEKDLPICIEWSVEVPSDKGISSWQRKLDPKLKHDPQAPKVLIVILQDIRARIFFDYLKTINKSFQLIGTDTWSSFKGPLLNIVPPMSLAIEPSQLHIESSREFQMYLKNVTLKNVKSPWMSKLIQQESRCCYQHVTSCQDSPLKTCTGSEKPSPVLSDSELGLTYSGLIKSAMIALQSTLINLHQKLCDKTRGMCNRMAKMTGDQLFAQFILSSEFKEGSRSAPPNYDLWFPKQPKNWSTIGKFSLDNGLQINETFLHKISEHSSSIRNETTRFCYPRCHIDNGFPVTPTRDTCCWMCQPCQSISSLSYINTTLSRCLQCEVPFLPDISKHSRRCIYGVVTFYPFHHSLIILAAGTLGIGIFLCLMQLKVILRHYKSPIIKTPGDLQTPVMCSVTSIIIMGTLIFHLSYVTPLPIPVSCSLVNAVWGISSILMIYQQGLILTYVPYGKVIDNYDRVQFFRKAVYWFGLDKKLIIILILIQVLVLMLIQMVYRFSIEQILTSREGESIYVEIHSAFLNTSLLCLFIPSFIVLLLVLAHLVIKIRPTAALKNHESIIKAKKTFHEFCSCMIPLVIFFALILLELLFRKPYPTLEKITLRMTSICLLLGLFCFTSQMLISHYDLLLIITKHSTNPEWIERLPFAQILELPRSPRRVLQLGRLIDSGYFGQVYEGNLCRDNGGFEKVAVKQLHFDTNSLKAEKFHNEALYLHQIAHPNIVKFHTTVHGIQRGMCLVLEFMDRGSLKEFIHLSSLDLDMNLEKTIQKLLLDVTEACRYLEKLKVVHGDLKWENVLVKSSDAARPDSSWTAKLSDFGLARSLNEDNCEVPWDSYIAARISAPELHSAEPTDNVKSDVWPFALLIWQVHHYRDSVFGNRSNQEVSQILSSRDPAVIENIESMIFPRQCLCERTLQLSTANRRLISQCLNRNPENRPGFKQIRDHFHKQVVPFRSPNAAVADVMITLAGLRRSSSRISGTQEVIAVTRF